MKTWKIVLVSLVVLIGTPIACSVLSTTAAVTTAPGRVVQKALQTDNIIGNYEAFFNRKAAYDARLAQVRGHAKLATLTTDQAELNRLRVELSAMQQSCREIATQYNADARKANRSIFKSGDLPDALSETACENS